MGGIALPQSERGLLYPRARAVVERKNLPNASKTKIRGYGKQGGAIREVAMDENDGSLIGLARRAAVRPSDSKRKERGCRNNAESLLGDQAPCRSLGHPIVLYHRVLPRPRTVSVPQWLALHA